jgi:hypothetical protein
VQRSGGSKVIPNPVVGFQLLEDQTGQAIHSFPHFS